MLEAKRSIKTIPARSSPKFRTATAKRFPALPTGLLANIQSYMSTARRSRTGNESILKGNPPDMSRRRTVPAAVREAVIERDGYKCFMCGMTRRQSIETMGHDLHVHHADQSGSEKNPNNEMENLVTLDVLCHQKVHSITHKLLKRYVGKAQKQEIVDGGSRGLGTRLSRGERTGELAGRGK